MKFIVFCFMICILFFQEIRADEDIDFFNNKIFKSLKFNKQKFIAKYYFDSQLANNEFLNLSEKEQNNIYLNFYNTLQIGMKSIEGCKTLGIIEKGKTLDKVTKYQNVTFNLVLYKCKKENEISRFLQFTQKKVKIKTYDSKENIYYFTGVSDVDIQREGKMQLSDLLGL